MAGFCAGLIVDVATLGHARPDRAPADARRVLGRALRRDDGPGRAHAPLLATRRRDRVRRARGLRAPVDARRVRLAARRSRSRSPSALIWNAAAHLPGLRARRGGSSGAPERVERATGGRAPCLTPRTASGATRRRASCHPIRRVSAPYRLTPGLAVRVGVLGVVALAVFALLFFRLWSLQVLSGADYLDAAQNNQLRTIRVEAPRGPILDRKGTRDRRERPGNGRQALGRRHAQEGGALPHDQAARRRARRTCSSASLARSTRAGATP